MPALSYRSSLVQIGEPRPGHPIPPWPSGFHCSPRTLRSALLAMRPPRINEWTRLPLVHELDNMAWTEECNGLTSDGRSWYFASSNADLPAIHKLTLDFKPITFVGLEKGTHIGDIDFFGGRIFAPLDPDPRRIATFDISLALLSVDVLDPAGQVGDAPHTGNPWCAINPLNGLLYSSNFDGVDRIHAYDPAEKLGYRGALRLGGPPVGGVQGGAFTANGHFYLTSDTFVGKNATKDIRAYSSLNGEFLGSLKVPYDTSFLEAEEMEGFAIVAVPMLGHIHVVILDNDAPSGDDVFLKHFMVPDPAVL